MHYYRNTEEKLLDFRINRTSISDYICSVKLVQINNILVDINTFLGKKWICDRMQCIHNKTLRNCGTCCNGGGIISPSDELKVFKYTPYAKKYLEEDKVEMLKNGQLCQGKYQLNESGGTCIFLASSGYDRFCSLHKVSEDLNINTIETKGFDCYIEPIEMIVLDSGMIFLTIISSLNQQISRWGDALPCVDHPFINAPAIIDSTKNVLEFCFGEIFYKQLKTQVEMKE